MMDDKGFERKPVIRQAEPNDVQRHYGRKIEEEKQQCQTESVLRTSETAIRYGNCIIQRKTGNGIPCKTQLISQEIPVYRNSKMQSSGGIAKGENLKINQTPSNGKENGKLRNKPQTG